MLGLTAALVAGRVAFGPVSFGSSRTATPVWFAIAFAAGLLISRLTVLVPALRDLRASRWSTPGCSLSRRRSPWWTRAGVDLILLAGATVVFLASSRNNYTLVLAPEGVATHLGVVLGVPRPGPAVARVGVAALAAGAARAHPRPAAAQPTDRTRSPAGWPDPVPPPSADSAGARPCRRPPRPRCLVRRVDRGVQRDLPAAGRGGRPADQRCRRDRHARAWDRHRSRAAAGLAATPGVRNVEPIQHRFAYVGADLQDLYGVRPASITRATALQDAYFQGGSATALMATLAARPDAVLVSAETVKDFQLNPGDLLNLRLQDGASRRLRTVPFHYVGVVNEFPTAPKDSFFVANADYVAKTTGSAAVGAFLVDTGGRDQPTSRPHSANKVGDSATVTDITQTRSQVGSSLTSVNLAGLTRLELTFAVLLAASAGGLVLAAGLAERRRSLAIISVLGARRRQLRGLVLAEAALVTVGGVLGGALIAWGLSTMLVKVLTGVFDPPPSAIAVPIGYLAVTVLAVLAAMAAALASARTSTRPAVEELREL